MKCSWMVYPVDAEPHECGKQATVEYVRTGYSHGKWGIVERYPRCKRHATAAAQAIVDADPDWCVLAV